MVAKIQSYIIRQMREMKGKGESLKHIASELKIAKSTASYYCRDLFTHPERIYSTEREARAHLKSVKKKKPCTKCGIPIKFSAITGLCRPCLGKEGFFLPFLQGGGAAPRKPRESNARKIKVKIHTHCIHKKAVLNGNPSGYHGNYGWLRPVGDLYCCTAGCKMEDSHGY